MAVWGNEVVWTSIKQLSDQIKEEFIQCGPIELIILYVIN